MRLKWDAVDVAGTLLPITMQETDSHLVFAPSSASWTSASSTSSSGYTIDLDAVDVIGVLR